MNTHAVINLVTGNLQYRGLNKPYIFSENLQHGRNQIRKAHFWTSLAHSVLSGKQFTIFPFIRVKKMSFVI